MRFLRASALHFQRLSFILSACATIAMALHVTADVLMKYLFVQPIVGTLEMVSYYYMVAAVFLPLAIVEAEKRQVFVELFSHNLPSRVISAMDAFVKLLLMVYVGILGYTGYVSALRKTQALEYSQNVNFDIYIWPSRWFVVVGCLGMFFYIVIHFIEDITHAATGKHLEDEADAEHGRTSGDRS